MSPPEYHDIEIILKAYNLPSDVLGLPPIEPYQEPVHQADTIKAWKIVQLRHNTTQGWSLRSKWDGMDLLPGWKQAYHSTNTAAFPGHDGPYPRLACSCGFYGMKEPDWSFQPYGEMLFGVLWVLVMAQVELAGTVMEHELGYRAEYQRVVDLRVGPWRRASGKNMIYPSPQVRDEMSRVLGIPVLSDG